MSDDAPLTELLPAWSAGDAAAREALLPRVYGELRRRANAYLRRERPGHILQPTALVATVKRDWTLARAFLHQRLRA